MSTVISPTDFIHLRGVVMTKEEKHEVCVTAAQNALAQHSKQGSILDVMFVFDTSMTESSIYATGEMLQIDRHIAVIDAICEVNEDCEYSQAEHDVHKQHTQSILDILTEIAGS